MLNHYTQAISTNYANFQGRARRSEYWSFVLINMLVGLAASMIDAVLNTALIYPLYTLALLVPGTAITVRRLHDVGRSGWWFLIAFTGIGAFVLLYWYLQDSHSGSNSWGANPKEPNGNSVVSSDLKY